MKPFTIYTIVLCLCFTPISILASEKTNISLKTINIVEEKLVLPKKRTESNYKKFERLFSDYDGTFFEDMLVYSVDMMMPDEMMQAVKDVIKNREHQGFDDKSRQFPKTLSNDAYNILLTTTYYYIQDISRISQKVWNKSVCSPDTFRYEKSREPKVFLALKESDENARGITKRGVVLPIHSNFPDAQYPYASKPNGCSAEELEYIYDLSNTFSNDDEWFSKACDEHDKCYFTEGTTYKECNDQFIIDTIDACNNITGLNTLLFMGTKNAFCGVKALTISTGANACAQKYFDKTQKKQKVYNAWVLRYEKAYLEAKQKTINEKK